MTNHEDPDLSALYRRTPRHEPDAASDRLILDAAHAAVSRGRRQRLAPWAIAATLLLGVGIGWQVFQTPVPEDLAEPVPRMSPSLSIDRATHPENDAADAKDVPEPILPEPLQTAPRPAAVYSEHLLDDVEAGVPDQAFRRSLSAPPLATQGQTEARQQGMAAKSVQSASVRPDSALSVAADCDGLVPEDRAAKAQWDTAIEAARRQGNAALLPCLYQQYQTRFGYPYLPTEHNDAKPSGTR